MVYTVVPICVHSRRHCRIIPRLGTIIDTIFEGIAYAPKEDKRKDQKQIAKAIRSGK